MLLSIQKTVHEIDELGTKKLSLVKSLETNRNKLHIENEQLQAKVKNTLETIEQKQKLRELYLKKIDLLESNFSKAEIFLLKLLPVFDRTDAQFLGRQGTNLLDPMRSSTPDHSTIEILKTQHKKSLVTIKEFYAKCDTKLTKLNNEIGEYEEMLR